MGELALLIYVDTRFFALVFFRSTSVCTYFFSEIAHPPLKKKHWPVQGLKLMEKFLPLLLRLQKRKLLGETGLFCTSSSLLAIWFRCSVLSFFLACHAKFSFKSAL